jgi:hypothetical protein
MTDGYLYCFSNPSMPGILKIGMTERTPAQRLAEANSSDTWRPPTPYKCVFAKKVTNPRQKEITIHTLLSQYTERINPKREFFRVSCDEVRTFFDLLDGELLLGETLLKGIDDDDDDDNDDDDDDDNDIANQQHKMHCDNKNITPCRDMSKCFTHGQQIRHKIGITNIWIGAYDSLSNGITYDGKIYKSLTAFAKQHYTAVRPDRCNSANGWKECECDINGIWISTFDLN